ncbi:hypothetical protein V6N12_011082 [Hibiscus sabdariffa]|uniref:Uncharacterized protein n=1 Tax=Hibiscus sabdariffa TaxID=183260 RepID=A0ABR2EM01_9ROSI
MAKGEELVKKRVAEEVRIKILRVQIGELKGSTVASFSSVNKVFFRTETGELSDQESWETDIAAASITFFFVLEAF